MSLYQAADLRNEGTKKKKKNVAPPTGVDLCTEKHVFVITDLGLYRQAM